MSEIDTNDQRNFPFEMIGWLSDKDPDVWFYVTDLLNWDFSEEVLYWLAEQKMLDKANAILIFCRLNPDEYVPSFDEDKALYEPEYIKLFHRIIDHWKSGYYERSELELRYSDIGDLKEIYLAAVSERADRSDPFQVPTDLLETREGRAPRVPENLKAENNPELRNLLKGLGTIVSA